MWSLNPHEGWTSCTTIPQERLDVYRPVHKYESVAVWKEHGAHTNTGGGACSCKKRNLAAPIRSCVFVPVSVCLCMHVCLRVCPCVCVREGQEFLPFKRALPFLVPAEPRRGDSSWEEADMHKYTCCLRLQNKDRGERKKRRWHQTFTKIAKHAVYILALKVNFPHSKLSKHR